MSTNLPEGSISSFLDSLAAKSATPGGGAVAAITGAQGCALISMVCHFSTDFEGASDMNNRAKQARASFLNLAEADIDAFNTVMAAYKLRRNEPGRAEKIQEALRNAAEAPKAMMILANSLIEDMLTLLNWGNKQLITDTGMIGILIGATIRSAELNIRINLQNIKDTNYRAEVISAIKEYKSRPVEDGQAVAQILGSLEAD